jgi:hypothetical protein
MLRLLAMEKNGNTAGFDSSLASRIFASWNQLDVWLRQVDRLRRVA